MATVVSHDDDDATITLNNDDVDDDENDDSLLTYARVYLLFKYQDHTLAFIHRYQWANSMAPVNYMCHLPSNLPSIYSDTLSITTQ